MADERVPAQYPHTTATTTGPVPPDRQPPHTQTTQPSTRTVEKAPEVRHASDDDHDNVA